jgi:hypothetical protein
MNKKMIQRRMTMHKYTYKSCLILATAAAVLCLGTGCGKKKQESADLSSTHTSAAAETMAESTESPKAEESEATITIDAPSPNTTAATAIIGGSSGKKIPVQQYKNNAVSISYPNVINVDDSTLESKINDTIKTHALAILDAYEIDEASDTVDIQCKVISADRSRFSVIYTGTISVKDAAHPVNVFYSDTIDLKTGKSLTLKDSADPYTLAQYVLSDACYFVSADGTLTDEEQSAQMEARNLMTMEEYKKLFDAADFSSDASVFPECFSYDDGGSIIFSIPVPHAAGDYALVSYTPEGK